MKNKYLSLLITLLILGFLGYVFINNSSNHKKPIKTTSNIVCKSVKTDSEAIAIVSNYSEVKDFQNRMKDAKQPTIFRAVKSNNNWNIQVAENQPTHLATFNWYTIDNCGKLKCSLSIYDKTGKYIRGSTAKEYPCN